MQKEYFEDFIIEVDGETVDFYFAEQWLCSWNRNDPEFASFATRLRGLIIED